MIFFPFKLDLETHTLTLDICVQRLAHPAGSSHRMQLACEQIPLNFTDKDGYHRDCYQRFTMNLNRLKPATQTGPQTQTRPKRSRSSEGVIFDSDCIFCGNFGRKKSEKNSWTTEGLSSFECGGGGSILRLAEMRHDDDYSDVSGAMIFLPSRQNTIRAVVTNTMIQKSGIVKTMI